ncbi:response regulator [soil metagenome]
MNVLIVDDHPENLLTLEAILQDMNLNLVRANSGREALRCVLKEDFALILLDVRMGDIDGLETARLIRERERSKDTPIIFLTAYSAADEQIFQGYASGAVDYLFKPFVPEILKSKVRGFVEVAKKSAELKRLNETLEQQVEERTRALLLAEKRYRSIFENSSEGVYQTDANGRFVMANPAMASMLGYESPADLLEQIGNVGTQVYEETRRREDFLRLATEHGTVQNFEYKAVRKDGSRIWISENSRVIVDDAGQLVGHEGMAIEITERKNADDIIATRQRDLETLLYVISHDLREPLRAIVGYSTLVLERNREKLDEQAIDFLGRVTSSTTRLETLLNDVQMLIRAQRMAPPKDEVNCAHLVKEALTLLQGRIDETGARIRVSENLPRLCLDSTWARQAIFNLVANALKFTTSGKPPDIEIVEYVPKEGYDQGAGIIVRDRGPGVKPRNARKIFELFKREVGRDVEGTGAGLAIVSAVARRHNGAAWIEHREGGGSDFIITFGPAATSCDEKPSVENLDAIPAE